MATFAVTNWLQFEYGLIPSRIFADDKEEYIKVLVETRESENLDIFRSFMTDMMIRHLTNDISALYRPCVKRNLSDISSPSIRKSNIEHK